MEVSSKAIIELETRIGAMEVELNQVKVKVDSSLIILERIDRGLNGDEDNDVPGLRDNFKELRKEVDTLKAEVAGIHQKNKDQDLLINGKKEERVSWGVKAKKVFDILIYIVTAYYVLKGTVGIDVLASFHK